MRNFPKNKDNQKSYGVSLIKMGGDDDEKLMNENIPLLIQWLWGSLKDKKYEA